VALLVASSQAVLLRQTRTCASSYSRRGPRRITILRTGSPRASCRTLRQVRAPCVCTKAARAQRSEIARQSCHADSVLAAAGVSTVSLSFCTFRAGEKWKRWLTVTGDICMTVMFSLRPPFGSIITSYDVYTCERFRLR
jgi:hypothetical protein